MHKLKMLFWIVPLTLMFCSNGLGWTDNSANDAIDRRGSKNLLSLPVQKVKVYIMLGQSNMLGFGRIAPEDKTGTLEYFVKQKKKYPQLVDASGAWVERKDVRYVHVMDARGGSYKDMDRFRFVKNQWLKPTGRAFGPELGFGSVVGDHHDEPVLLLKACIGNRSLGWDLLPPGSKSFQFKGKTYAGYRENTPSWEEGKPKKAVNWYAGRQYDADTAHAKAVLKEIGKYIPGATEYEIAGFVFWQGHKDQNAAHASRYEQNLVRFIKSLRRDFDAPKAKFVLATIAFGGNQLKGHGLTVLQAQLSVSEETGKHPEFKGNVKCVDARPFWREKSVSPSGQGYHYNHNAETYMEVGLALGKAILELD